MELLHLFPHQIGPYSRPEIHDLQFHGFEGPVAEEGEAGLAETALDGHVAERPEID